MALARSKDSCGSLACPGDGNTAAGMQLQLRNPSSLPLRFHMQSDFLQENSETTIHADTKNFVHTEEFEEAVDTLAEKKCVVLTGPPGTGKTTLGHALLRKFSSEDNQDLNTSTKPFTPYVITHVQDVLKHVGEKEKSVLLLDGTLGEVSVDLKQLKYWRFAVRSLLPLCESGACLVVLTAYPHVLRELEKPGSDSPLRLTDHQVRLPQGPWSLDVKRSLLNVHLKDVALEPEDKAQLIQDILEVDLSGPSFPWCCRQLVKNWEAWKEDREAIFQQPGRAYVPLLQRMIRHKKEGNSFTAVFALVMLGRTHFLHDPSTCQPELSKLGLGDLPAFQLAEYANYLKGSILSKTGDAFHSRVLYDAVGLALANEVTMPILLKVCDFRFLQTHARPESTGNKFTVNFGSDPRDTRLLAARIWREIENRRVQEVCHHPVICDQGFREELLAVPPPAGLMTLFILYFVSESRPASFYQKYLISRLYISFVVDFFTTAMVVVVFRYFFPQVVVDDTFDRFVISAVVLTLVFGYLRPRYGQIGSSFLYRFARGLALLISRRRKLKHS